MISLSPEWQNFFVAELGALAALTGLIVVAISINLTRILSIESLPERAGESLIMLVGAIVIASLALVPEQPTLALGAELLVAGSLTWLAPVFNQMRTWNLLRGVDTTKKIARLVTTTLASAPFVVASVFVLSQAQGALYWAAGGIIMSLMAGVWNVWILLVEILR